MREIKFRAWDKELKGWVVEPLWFEGGKVYILRGKSFAELNQIRTNVMQYTGLKDKNGKEIYEGDIVKYNASIEADNEIQKKIMDARSVLFRDEIMQVEWDNEGADFQMVGGDSCRGFNGRGEESIEIIGSKFENPELLSIKE